MNTDSPCTVSQVVEQAGEARLVPTSVSLWQLRDAGGALQDHKCAHTITALSIKRQFLAGKPLFEVVGPQVATQHLSGY